MYNESQRKELLSIARKAIENVFEKKSPELPEKYTEKRGVFVTLKRNHSLRGCIGLPYPTKRLEEAIAEAAISAAFNDPRFQAVGKDEIKAIKIEISVLSIPEPAKPEEIKVGKHGIMCQYEGHSGLLLPQVATEEGLSKEAFLEALCDKAFLGRECWKQPGFKLQKFEAEIFSE
jgi:AmmeMemoRadiSam system protein A